MRGRPRKYEVNETTTIRFYVPKAIKKEFQMYCIENEITLQEVMECKLMEFLHEEIRK